MTVPLTGHATRLAVSPDGKLAYAADFGNSVVSVVDVDARAVLRTIKPGCAMSPRGAIVLSRDGTRLYTACERSSVVAVTETATGNPVDQPITVGWRPAAMILSPDGSQLYVVTLGTGDTAVTVIDTVTGKPVGRPIPTGRWLVPAETATPAAVHS